MIKLLVLLLNSCDLYRLFDFSFAAIYAFPETPYTSYNNNVIDGNTDPQPDFELGMGLFWGATWTS